MNLQIKCDRAKAEYKTCSKIYAKVSDFERICGKTNKILDLKIEDCKSDLSLTKKTWYLHKTFKKIYF